MTVIDDHLALDVLAGTPPPRLAPPCTTTYGFYVRLLTAVQREQATGRLDGARDPDVAELLAKPPADLLVVVDPLGVVEHTARLIAEHGANLLLAEVGAVASATGQAVRVAPSNATPRWTRFFDELGIDFATVGS